jgi:hypothetical protein
MQFIKELELRKSDFPMKFTKIQNTTTDSAIQIDLL